jgi:hypothetical protein
MQRETLRRFIIYSGNPWLLTAPQSDRYSLVSAEERPHTFAAFIYKQATKHLGIRHARLFVALLLIVVIHGC